MTPSRDGEATPRARALAAITEWRMGGVSTLEIPAAIGRAARNLTPYYTIALFVILFAFFSIINGDRFYDRTNITNILGQSAIMGIVAAGLCVPLILNEFDLSVGWHASLAGVMASNIAVDDGTMIAIIITLAAGLIIGNVNGFVVSKLKVPSLIATLGLGAILVGISQKISLSLVFGLPSSFGWLGQHQVLTVPVAVLFMLGFAFVLWLLTTQLPLGRWMYAIGGSREAARLAGLNITAVTWIAFVISGVAASFGGILLSSRLMGGTPGAADGFLLDGFTAAALGMVTLRRGEFNIIGTVIAVVLLMMLLNGMTMAGWAPYYQNMLKGVILIVAVAATQLEKRTR